jgi:hypothetical protein
MVNRWKELALLLYGLVCRVHLSPQAIHIQRVGDLLHDFLLTTSFKTFANDISDSHLISLGSLRFFCCLEYALDQAAGYRLEAFRHVRVA